MAIIILPDAQEGLLSLQKYMHSKWSDADWLYSESEIFEKLALGATGLLTGAPVQDLAYVGIFEYQDLAYVGIFEYQDIFTSHHKLLCRRINGDFYVYTVAWHRQDHTTLLTKWLLKNRSFVEFTVIFS